MTAARIMQWFVALVVAVAWAMASFSWAATAVPQSGVKMDPPPGFVLSERFTGFELPAAEAAIVVTEMKRSFAQVSVDLSRDKLAAAGMTLQGFDEVGSGTIKARLFAVTQISAAKMFEKWLLLFGNKSQSLLIVASYPQAQSKSLSKPMRQALLSARWDPASDVTVLEGLPFDVVETDKLKVVRRLADTLIFAGSIMQKTDSLLQPLLVVGFSTSDAELDELESFAKQRLLSVVKVKEITIQSGRALTINNLSAYETIANAKDEKTGLPLRLYQAVIVDGAQYFILQGFVGMQKAGEFVPEFRSIANSLRRRS